MTLAEIPTGARIFLDANVLVFHFGGDNPFRQDCLGLMQRIEDEQIQGLTSSIAVAETLHRLMVGKAREQLGLATSLETVTYPKKHPEVVKGLRRHLPVPSLMARLGIDIKPVGHIEIHSSKRFRTEHGLLVNDSLLLAVMARWRVRHLATNDRDFDRIPGIQVWMPAAFAHSVKK
jgi:hypothetical protein